MDLTAAEIFFAVDLISIIRLNKCLHHAYNSDMVLENVFDKLCHGEHDLSAYRTVHLIAPCQSHKNL